MAMPILYTVVRGKYFAFHPDFMSIQCFLMTHLITFDIKLDLLYNALDFRFKFRGLTDPSIRCSRADKQFLPFAYD